MHSGGGGLRRHTSISVLSYLQIKMRRCRLLDDRSWEALPFRSRVNRRSWRVLGEDHDAVPFRHSVFSWPRPNSCRAKVLMLPNADWRSADRPACAALPGLLPDSQQIGDH